jgi:hypothetical protein
MPWNEEAHCQIMAILARGGERSASLAQYERCRHILAEELSVEPSADTQALYERILALRKSPRPTLPLQTTPFLGRKKELDQLQDHLSDPACRLLTVLGPGGIGKSRLASQVASLRSAAYFDGVYLVQLAGVISQGDMLISIVRALGLQFNPSGDPMSQLLNYLRTKELMLVLDNCEHLLGQAGNLHGIDLINELLENSPDVNYWSHPAPVTCIRSGC